MASTNDNISKNLIYYMKLNDLNNKELSEILGVSESTVGKWLLKKATPRMGVIEQLAEYFGINKSDILERKEVMPVGDVRPISAPSLRHLPFVPESVAAGEPLTIDAIQAFDTLPFPVELLGKHARNKNLIAMEVNGDSMNEVIPHGSYIILNRGLDLKDYKNGDIVVFSNGREYSLKYFYNDRENERIIFKPASSDPSFTDIVYSYDGMEDIRLEGKVVMYSVVVK